MPDTDIPRLQTCEMLAKELAHVRGIATPAPEAAYDTALSLELNALCLSGGGIRSAAFSLGVLQALAGKEVLRGFDYLSTVSGGGFIGGWLQQLLRGDGRTDPPDPVQRVVRVERILRGHEPGALGRLRDKTNYLTPKTGPASPDTWAGVALYVRNLVLNWIVFLPVFLLIALLPIFHRTLIWWAGEWMAVSHALSISFTALLMLLPGYVVYLGCRWLPSHRPVSRRIGKDNLAQYRLAIWTIIGAALVWAMLMPVSLQTLLSGLHHGPWFHPGLILPAVYVIVLLVAYHLAARCGAGEDPAPGLFAVNRLHWLFATLGSAAVFAIWLQVLLRQGAWLVYYDKVADALTLGGPIVLLSVLLAQSTFYLGLRREALYGALDREWLASLNGRILGIGIGWTVFAACCLIPSMLITLPHGKSQPWSITFTAVGTLVSGFASSWLGKQMISRVQALASDASKTDKLIMLAQLILPLVFLVALFALLSALLQLGLGNARPLLGQPPAGLDGVPLLLQLGLGLALGGLIYWFGRIINVNRFSMHAVYRNRLIRAFLGTPRDTRKPDPLTGFDDEDDPRLKAFKSGNGKGQRLFPVINMTLNISTGGRDAWAERKGASFTATPLHCGSAELRRDLNRSAMDPEGVYVPTVDFAGKESDQDERGEKEGTHLGSMLTVSGAAASPNWGYHSSPQVAFLMALFNVRLGAWYPNPAHAKDTELGVAKPRNSLLSLLFELIGRTADDEQAVYLSDGGHFENLGVYEMLRRRCRRILVVDAGQDGGCSFFDLGMMIRKAEIDLPVKIALTTTQIASRAAIEGGHGGKLCGFAHGTISYLDDRGSEIGQGRIIYIKPCLLPDTPAAIRAFAAGSKAFPHESTGDQWFSESQFESYRALGEFQGRKLTGLLPPSVGSLASSARVRALFEEAATYINGPAPAVVASASRV